MPKEETLPERIVRVVRREIIGVLVLLAAFGGAVIAASLLLKLRADLFLTFFWWGVMSAVVAPFRIMDAPQFPLMFLVLVFPDALVLLFPFVYHRFLRNQEGNLRAILIAFYALVVISIITFNGYIVYGFATT